jgi:hypothetical protein
LEEIVPEESGLITKIDINDVIANIKKDNKSQEKIPRNSVFRIEVYAQSEQDSYFTFVTGECTSLIKEYLRFRSFYGENLTKDSPLIREQFNIRSKAAARKPQKITLLTINKKLERLINASRINTKGEVLRSHGFRKFAITKMNEANVNYSIREYLVGHRQSRGLDNPYVLPSVENQFVEWAKAIDLLTINSENRIKRKLVKIEGEHERKIARQDQEIARLRNKLRDNEIFIRDLATSQQDFLTKFEKMGPMIKGIMARHENNQALVKGLTTNLANVDKAQELVKEFESKAKTMKGSKNIQKV